jgi:transcriptional regulator with XRE-family HTH domain
MRSFVDTITLGKIIRSRRKEKKMTLKDLSLHCNVGERFLSELERGKSTIELGKTLKVLARLNIELLILPTDEVQKHKYKLSA